MCSILFIRVNPRIAPGVRLPDFTEDRRLGQAGN